MPQGTFRVTPANLKGIVHPDDWHIVRKILRKARREAGAYQAEFRIVHGDGSVRWLLATAAAGRDARLRIARISGVIIDITDRKEAEERQSLLAREVDHRAKNALAVVHAIVCLSRCDSVDQYVAAVEGRIQALARAHSLLSETRWQGANMAQIIEEELAPYRSPEFERVRISGQRVSLEPATAQAVALAVHELATNAAKYGALSSASGHVDVGWSMESGFVRLQWTESGGPRVLRPHGGGFGIRVITSSVEGQPGGKVDFEWRGEGLACAIRIPHKHRADLPEQVAPPSFSQKVIQAPVEVTKRVLLLEDESLIALMTAHTLTDLGVEVVGPFGKVAEALAAIEREAIDFAILDMKSRRRDGRPDRRRFAFARHSVRLRHRLRQRGRGLPISGCRGAAEAGGARRPRTHPGVHLSGPEGSV